MSNRLDQIIAATKHDLSLAMQRTSLERLESRLAEASTLPRRDFYAALQPNLMQPMQVICEIKRNSPARGVLQANANPTALAKSYSEGGAAALSVLTEPHFFQGSTADLVEARAATTVPVLRKDFIIDPWQLVEARLIGADATLLIAAVLKQQLPSMIAAAADYGLDALVEVHDEAELELAVAAGAKIIGVNNRNLHSFEIDIATAERLRPLIPASCIVVAESGLESPADFVRMAKAGYNAVLVGSYLMKSANPCAALQEALAAVANMKNPNP